MGAALKRQVSVFTPRNHVLRPQVVSSRYLASFPGHEKIPGFRLPGKDPRSSRFVPPPKSPGTFPHQCCTAAESGRYGTDGGGPCSRARARGICGAREGRDLVTELQRVNSQKVLIEALERELASIREQKAKLSQREAAIVKTLSTYTGTGQAVIRATREMNTVDMARTVIRNAGRPMKSKGRPR